MPTYTLTTSQFSYTGTAYDDVFNAPIESNGIQSLQTLDSINGNGGDDTLNTFINATVAPQVMTSIENINAVFSNAGAVLNLLNATDLVTLENASSTTAAQFSNIDSTDVELQISNVNGTATTFGFTAAAVVGDNVANVALSSAIGSGVVTINGVETINVSSAGSANDIVVAGNAVTAINVTGPEDLALNAVAAGVRTLNAATFEGDLAANITNQVTNVLATNVTGGLGDDVFTVTNANVGVATVASTLAGGDGVDVLAISRNTDSAAVVVANGTTITGMEIVALTAADDAGAGTAVDLTLNAALVGGLSDVVVRGQDANFANIFTVNNLTAAQAVSVTQVGDVGNTIDVTGAAGVTAANVELNIGADSSRAFDINEAGAATALTTLNITADANSYTNVDIEAGAFATLNILGGAVGESFVIGQSAGLNVTTLNAASLASDLDATFAASQVTVTGGTGNDIFRLGTTLAGTDSIDGGTGDNTVTFTTVAGLTAGTISNVQTLDIAVNQAAAGAFFSSLNVTGVETINLTETGAGGNGATFTNLKSTTNQVNLLDGFAGAISLSNAAGQAGASTLTIGDAAAGGGVTTNNVTYNNGAALTVNTVAPTVAATQAIGGTLNSNTTGLTLASVENGNLGVTGIITADSATSVTVNAVGSDIAAVAANSFDGLSNLTVTASGTGANITFESNTVTAGAATLASVAISASGAGSSVDMSNGALGGVLVESGANTNASITTLGLTNGEGADVNALVTVDSNAGAAGLSSVGTINLTNNGLVVGDTLTLALSLQNGAAVGGSTIGALNVTAGAASLTTFAIQSTGDTSPTISGGTFSGSGTVAINTTAVTNLNLSALTMTGYTGALTITSSDAAATTVVGTSYGETITGQAANAAVTGGGGSDAITLTNGGTANVVYVAQSDSTGTVYDYVTNFAVSTQADPDLINLAALGLAGGSYSNIGANATITVNGAVTTFAITEVNAATFFANGVAVASDNAGAAANTVVFIDANLSGAWEAGSDMAIVLVGVDTLGANPLSNADFVWA